MGMLKSILIVIFKKFKEVTCIVASFLLYSFYSKHENLYLWHIARIFKI